MHACRASERAKTNTFATDTWKYNILVCSAFVFKIELNVVALCIENKY